MKAAKKTKPVPNAIRPKGAPIAQKTKGRLPTRSETVSGDETKNTPPAK
jgi:hypothetical protein